MLDIMVKSSQGKAAYDDMPKASTTFVIEANLLNQDLMKKLKNEKDHFDLLYRKEKAEKIKIES
jgi:hypothetical protein